MSRINKKSADHVVARLSGVKEGDSKVDAALKAIAMAKLAGLPTQKMEKMLAEYRARTGE